MTKLTKQERNELHRFVESGSRTVRDILSSFGNKESVVTHIGYRVNLEAWSIVGVVPNGGGFGGKAGESEKTRLNEELGNRIVGQFLDCKINVEKPFKAKD
jgi:hypothetical protein